MLVNLLLVEFLLVPVDVVHLERLCLVVVACNGPEVPFGMAVIIVERLYDDVWCDHGTNPFRTFYYFRE